MRPGPSAIRSTSRSTPNAGATSRFWLAEHHNMPGIASAATAVVIGHVAAGTATSAWARRLMLPNHAPLMIAEQFGTLDTLYPDASISASAGRRVPTNGRRGRCAAISWAPPTSPPTFGAASPAGAGATRPSRARSAWGRVRHVPLWLLDPAPTRSSPPRPVCRSRSHHIRPGRPDAGVGPPSPAAPPLRAARAPPRPARPQPLPGGPAARPAVSLPRCSSNSSTSRPARPAAAAPGPRPGRPLVADGAGGCRACTGVFRGRHAGRCSTGIEGDHRRHRAPDELMLTGIHDHAARLRLLQRSQPTCVAAWLRASAAAAGRPPGERRSTHTVAGAFILDLREALGTLRRLLFERCQTTPGKPLSGTSASPV